MSSTETLRDMVGQLEASLATANDTMVRIKQRLDRHILEMGGVVQLPASPVPAKPITPAVTGPWPGVVNDAVRAVIIQAARLAGVSPWVLEAIQRWESANYTSHIFLTVWNPGGMKNSAAAAGLATPYHSPDGNVYAAYAGWIDGFLAHGHFLAQSRYDAARTARDIDAQVDAIAAAGYAEGDEEWRKNVKLIAHKYAASYADSGASPSHPTSTTPGSIGARIAAAAHEFVGHPTGGADSLFTYAPGTEDGNLGCADAVSSILIRAGVESKLLLSVAELDELLQGQGWTKVQDYRDGDVVIWSPTSTSGGHPHIGVIYLAGSVVHAINNSSSQRHVVDLVLSSYDRPISHVLRAPGA